MSSNGGGGGGDGGGMQGNIDLQHGGAVGAVTVNDQEDEEATIESGIPSVGEFTGLRHRREGSAGGAPAHGEPSCPRLSPATPRSRHCER